MSHDLTFRCQALQRFTLETHCIVSQIVEHSRFEDEKTSVDPPFLRLGFFCELPDRSTVQVEGAISGWRMD